LRNPCPTGQLRESIKFLYNLGYSGIEAISEQFGMTLKKRGRPAKDENDKYELISLRLHPKALAWAK
jgi:hypothetical protein